MSVTMVRCLVIFRNWQETPGYSGRLQDSKEEVGAKSYNFLLLCVVMIWLWGQSDCILVPALSFIKCIAIDKVMDFFQTLLRFSLSKLGIIMPTTGSPSVADRGEGGSYEDQLPLCV